jgi:hypothetical protein
MKEILVYLNVLKQGRRGTQKSVHGFKLIHASSSFIQLLRHDLTTPTSSR